MSYQKVNETRFDLSGRSGGVARFSIAAFRDSRESRLAVDRGKRSDHRMEAREFKRALKVLIVPPGAPFFFFLSKPFFPASFSGWEIFVESLDKPARLRVRHVA